MASVIEFSRHECRGVWQREAGITNRHSRYPCLGTAFLYSCIAVGVRNPQTTTLFFAHLDEYTEFEFLYLFLKNIESEDRLSPLEGYLIGGNDSSVSCHLGQQLSDLLMSIDGLTLRHIDLNKKIGHMNYTNVGVDSRNGNVSYAFSPNPSLYGSDMHERNAKLCELYEMNPSTDLFLTYNRDLPIPRRISFPRANHFVSLDAGFPQMIQDVI